MPQLVSHHGLLLSALALANADDAAGAGPAASMAVPRETGIEVLSVQTAPAWTAMLIGLSVLFLVVFVLRGDPAALARRKLEMRRKYEELMMMTMQDVKEREGKAAEGEGGGAPELPEASRVFGLLWDDVSEVPTVSYGIDAEEPVVKFTERLLKRALEKELREAIEKTRGASGGDAGAGGEEIEDGFKNGEKLREALAWARDTVAKKLGDHLVDANQLEEAETLLHGVGKMNRRADAQLLWNLLRPAFPSMAVAVPCCMAAQALQSIYYQLGRWQQVGEAAMARDDGMVLYHLMDLGLGHLIIWFFEIMSECFTLRASAVFGQSVRTGVLRALMNQDFAYFDKNSSGALQERLNRDAEELSGNFINLPQEMLGHIACIAFTLAQVAMVCPTGMFVVAVTPLPIICYCHWLVEKFNETNEGRGRKLQEEAAAATAEVLKEIRTVRQFACEELESFAFSRRETLRNQAREKSGIVQSASGKLIGVVIVTGLLYTEYIGAGLVKSGQMTPGLLFDITIKLNFWVVMRTVTLVNMMPRVRKAFEPLARVCELLRSTPTIEASGKLSAWGASSLSELEAALDRCETVSDDKSGRTRTALREEVALDGGLAARRGSVVAAWEADGEQRAMLGKRWLLEHPDLAFPLRLLVSEKRIPLRFEGRIEFDDVVFRYPTDLRKEVLTGLSFTVEPREKVALVGEAGCGKSSTMCLLQRLYDPLEGCIRIDGIPLQDYNVRFLRSRVVIVDQRPVLFASSVRDNIAYGLQREVSDEEIVQVLRDASLWEGDNGIKSKPDGILTKLGSGGVSLSGGQTQRVSIARAMIRKPDVILLDEATSALDNKNEKIVQETLDRLARQGSALVIAHRLTTIKDADKIVVMRKGRLAEQGSHQELLKMPIVREANSEGQQDVTQGIYRFLWELQFHTDADEEVTIERALKDLAEADLTPIPDADKDEVQRLLPKAIESASTQPPPADEPEMDCVYERMTELKSEKTMFRRLRSLVEDSACIGPDGVPLPLSLDRVRSDPGRGPGKIRLQRLTTSPL